MASKGTHFRGPLVIAGVTIVDASGNVVASITGSDLTLTGNTTLGDASSDTLTVNATSAFAAAVSSAVGVQNAAVARTATADGLTTGTIADGTSYVQVTAGADANSIIVLPTPTPGNVVWLNIGATGYELRSSAPATVAINGGTGASAESAVGANVLVRAVCTSATTWVCSTFSTIGTEAALEAAA